MLLSRRRASYALDPRVVVTLRRRRAGRLPCARPRHERPTAASCGSPPRAHPSTHGHHGRAGRSRVRRRRRRARRRHAGVGAPGVVATSAARPSRRAGDRERRRSAGSDRSRLRARRARDHRARRPGSAATRSSPGRPRTSGACGRPIARRVRRARGLTEAESWLTPHVESGTVRPHGPDRRVASGAALARQAASLRQICASERFSASSSTAKACATRSVCSGNSRSTISLPREVIATPLRGGR